MNTPINKFSIALLAAVSLLGTAACSSNYKKSNPSIGSSIRNAEGLDSLTIEEFAVPAGLDEEAKLDFLRLEAIENYRAYVDLLPAGQSKQEAKRRLADLLVQQGPSLRNEEEIRLLRANDKGANDGRDGRDGPTNLYLDLLAESTDQNDNDVVRYQLARAYVNDGKPQKAIEALTDLIKYSPTSELVGEANFRRGELFFIQREFENAEKAYLNVIADETAANFHDQARYKLGWSLFKQEKHLLALDAFHPLLEKLIPKNGYSVSQEKIDDNLQSLTRIQRNLVQDSLRVSAMSLVYLENKPTIGKYLESRPDRHYAVPLYQTLAELYGGKQLFKASGAVYYEFANNNTTHPLAPLFTERTIEAFEQAGFSFEPRKAKAYYATAFAPQKPYWSLHKQSDGKRVIKKARQYTLELAKFYHSQSQGATDARSKQEHTDSAARWYQHFLTQYSDDFDAPDTNYLYADLLYENARYQAAAAEYEKTAYQYPRHERSAEAGYAAVLALFKQADLVAQANGRKYDAALINAKEAAVNSAMRFTDVFATHQDVPKVLITAAEELFKLGDFRTASALSKRAVSQPPQASGQLAYAGWLVNAKSEFEQNNYPEAEASYRQLISLAKQLKPNDADTQYQLTENLALSIFRQGETQRSAGNLAAAADTFMRVVADAPYSSIAKNAHFDAAATYIELSSWEKATQSLLAFRKKYPGDSQQAEITRKLAGVYLNNKQPVLAADEFTRLGGSIGVDSATRQAALWQAATLYDENLASDAVSEKRVAKAYETYVEQFPLPLSDATEARQRLVELNSSMNNRDMALYWRGEILRGDQNSQNESNDRTRSLASASALELANNYMVKFEAIKLQEPLQASIKSKKIYMKQALDMYGTVQNYGYAEHAPEAAFRIGQVYSHFATTLLTSERPKGLDELELEEYNFLLEEQAFPLEEKAVEAHLANARRMDQGLYDKYIAASLKDLAALNPGRYAKRVRSDNYVTSLD